MQPGTVNAIIGYTIMASVIAILLFPASLLAIEVTVVQEDQRSQIRWENALNQKPEWYAGAEALRVAENLLLWQRLNGGWPKNLDMAVVLGPVETSHLANEQSNTDTTIDNGATRQQMIYLSRVFNATKQSRLKEAFLKGLDYLLAAQYANGGWPQYYPLRQGYYSHITFNDDAMAGVLTLLDEIARKSPAYTFVDEARRKRAKIAVAKGIECILKTQVVMNGKRTAWCAQHDEVTLQPAPARAYEKVSLSGSESAGIVLFLMGIEKPDSRVIEAIQGAVAWFRQARLTGIKVVEKPDPLLPRGFDRVVVQDAQAPPMWARFYEIGTNRPIFCGRDGVIKYSLAEIEHERRIGYRWYCYCAESLLTKDFPAWQAKRRGNRVTPPQW